MGYDFDCAVVTGASGFIGQALMRFLADRNVFVYGIVRHVDDARLFRSERVVYIPCPMDAYDNLTDAAGWARAQAEGVLSPGLGWYGGEGAG